MKNFNLEKNEELLLTLSNVTIYANDNKFILDVFLTNKRLVLLKDVNKELTYNTFLNAKGIGTPSDYEVVFDINLKDISIKYIDDYNYITFKDNSNVLKIYSKNLEEIIKDKKAI